MDRITEELADLLTKPAIAAELLGDGCDALQQVEQSTFIRLLTAKPGEYGSACDDFRSELAGILAGYEHASEMAQKRIAKADADDARLEHAEWERAA